MEIGQGEGFKYFICNIFIKGGHQLMQSIIFFVDWVRLSKSQPTKLQYSIDLIVVFAIFAVVTTIFFFYYSFCYELLVFNLIFETLILGFV